MRLLINHMVQSTNFRNSNLVPLTFMMGWDGIQMGQIEISHLSQVSLNEQVKIQK